MRDRLKITAACGLGSLVASGMGKRVLEPCSLFAGCPSKGL
jgi:hypothetical protein